MITDKLLTFADQKPLTANSVTQEIDLGGNGIEIARTMNLVVQFDQATGTHDNLWFQATLQGVVPDDDANAWVDLAVYKKVKYSNVKKNGERIVNFEKLPLVKASKLRIKIDASVTSGSNDISGLGIVMSAFLTPSVEA